VIFRQGRRLYRWVVGWADRPAALVALFVISFAESSFFPIPPDVLLIPLCFGRPRRGHVFAGVCTLASVLGGMAGYGLGTWASGLGHDLVVFFSSEATFEVVRRQFEENTFLYVAIAGFTPIPYKVFTISAGIFHVSFPVFVLASVLSRGARFFLEAGVVRLFGDRAREFLERRFELATIVLALLGVGGFLAVKFLF
jgi:membrane protein YqaA with SNARE-associated domain